MPRGGKRAGAGKPKGTKHRSTITKEQARDAFRAVVIAHMEELLKAQLAHAKGIDHFFLRNKQGQFERVTDPKIIEAALNSGDQGSYYWIFTKDPSTQAFTDLMNRALDKPAEQVKVTGADDGPVQHTYRWLRPDETS